MKCFLEVKRLRYLERDHSHITFIIIYWYNCSVLLFVIIVVNNLLS
jgi:hypothetical protein